MFVAVRWQYRSSCQWTSVASAGRYSQSSWGRRRLGWVILGVPLVERAELGLSAGGPAVSMSRHRFMVATRPPALLGDR